MIVLALSSCHKCSKFVDHHLYLVLEDGIEKGKITGWIASFDDDYEEVFQKSLKWAASLMVFKDFVIEKQLRGKVWFFEGFETYPEYQGNDIGSEAAKLHQNIIKCDYLVGQPYPLHSSNKSEEEIKKDSEFLTTYYIDYHTYKGRWERFDDTDIIMKKILE